MDGNLRNCKSTPCYMTGGSTMSDDLVTMYLIVTKHSEVSFDAMLFGPLGEHFRIWDNHSNWKGL